MLLAVLHRGGVGAPSFLHSVSPWVQKWSLFCPPSLLWPPRAGVDALCQAQGWHRGVAVGQAKKGETRGTYVEVTLPRHPHGNLGEHSLCPESQTQKDYQWPPNLYLSSPALCESEGRAPTQAGLFPPFPCPHLPLGEEILQI